MATYQIYAPCYVQGKYLGQFATNTSPARITTPDDVEPSVTWDPVDEAAAKALSALGEKKIKAQTAHLNPKTEEHKIQQVTEAVRKQYRKVLVQATVEKLSVKEVNTNSQIAGQTGKVVGRDADRSPIG